MNSVLQVLFSLPIFSNLRTWLRQGDSRLLDLFAETAEEWSKPNPLKFLSCKEFKSECWILNVNFSSNRQQDVAEFLRVFFDYTHSILKKNNALGENMLREIYYSQTVRHRPRCNGCGLKTICSHDSEDFIMLLPVNKLKETSLEELISDMFSEEQTSFLWLKS